MLDKFKKLIVISLISIIPTILIWAPFFFRLDKLLDIPLNKQGMATIVANYDGPLFIVVAKTFYDKEKIKQNFSFDLPSEYYPAHFPLFPFFIRILSPLTGYPYAMLLVTVISSIAAIYFFNKLATDYVGVKNSLWITVFFSFFPARWLIVRSVGSSEPLFLLFIISSIYYFNKKNFLLAGILGSLATLTKSPGILLFVSYIFSYFLPKLRKLSQSPHETLSIFDLGKFIPLFLIPFTLTGLFYFYKIKTGDFLAYFHSGDNIHLFFPPFQIFNYKQPWVGTFWLEEIIFVYLFSLIGLIKLIKIKQESLAWFVGIFFVSILFVSHRDLIRYSLPIVPFIYIAFANELLKKEFKIILLFLFIPVYLFSLAYICQNVMPIPDWLPLL